MSHSLSRTAVFAPALLALAALAGAADPPTAPPPRPVDVGAIVRQLGSRSFEEREEATERLSSLPLDAPPAELVEATRSPNPEVSRRAARAVEAIRARAADRALDRFGRERAFAKRGKV